MTSLLYPFVIPKNEPQFTDQFITYDLLTSVIVDSQLQILLDYTEERINGLRLKDRLSSLHTTLIRSGMQFFRLELELAIQGDSAETLPAPSLINFQLTDELSRDSIAAEIEIAKHHVNRLGQEKFLARHEVSILVCGLNLLVVEWENFANARAGIA